MYSETKILPSFFKSKAASLLPPLCPPGNYIIAVLHGRKLVHIGMCRERWTCLYFFKGKRQDIE